MSGRTLATVLAVGLSLVSGCDYGFRLSPKRSAPEVAKTTLKPPALPPTVDPIGEQPKLGALVPFEPKPPEIFQGPGGLTVWLVERPELPIVSASFILPYGSANDPEEAPGTMALLADMLDEGAGPRDALQVSETIGSLGATLSLSTGADASTAEVLSLRDKFDTTFEVLCDVVARPHLSEADFRRTKKIWKNALKKRSDDPGAVASVVTSAILYGSKTPYGHPALGLYSKADKVTLPGITAAYKRAYRPDRASLVVVGQIKKRELLTLLEKHLASWKADKEPLPPASPSGIVEKRPKIVVVDRPKAVQTVINVSREGIAASDERAPILGLVNDALGGSFTSRLNLLLREEKGFTYGIGSSFTSRRGQGAFVIGTSVEAVHTGESLKLIMGELSKMSESGLTEEEVGKVKAQDRATLVETYESVTGTADRLSSLVTLGLPATFDAGAMRIRQGASKEDLARLAKAHVDPSVITIVLVGDAQVIKKQLSEQGFEAPVAYGPEGQPL